LILTNRKNETIAKIEIPKLQKSKDFSAEAVFP
jgi:hypothetical protein